MSTSEVIEYLPGMARTTLLWGNLFCYILFYTSSSYLVYYYIARAFVSVGLREYVATSYSDQKCVWGPSYFL
jgi:hypothetical protein